MSPPGAAAGTQAPAGGQLEVTLKDVAARAGVHSATASRALHEETRTRVSRATVDRVLAAAHELGYVPNHAAASLRTKHTWTIGLLVPDLTDPLIPPLVRGADDVLTAAGYTVMLAETSNDAGREGLALAQMRARRVDGLILAGHTARPELMASAARTMLPAVVAGYTPDGRALPSAAADLPRAAHLIMTHLAACGHRVIACLTGPGASIGRADLLAAARACGLRVPARLTLEARELTAAEGGRLTARLLETGMAFTAVVTSSDILAAGCCAGAAKVGRPCPGGISVTGFGDLLLSSSLTPALTTVRLPQEAVGASAARLLLGQLGEPGPVPAAARRQPELIARGSVGPA